MAKPEWGQKRTCTSCGCRFYDLTRTPIVCPKCGATVEPDVPFKVRRGSAAAVAAAEKAAAAAAAAPVRDIVEADADDLPLDDEDEAAEGDEDAEDEMIEDASDLGEDDDDMAEVMEHMDEEIEDEV